MIKIFSHKLVGFSVAFLGCLLLFPDVGSACVTEYDGGPCYMPPAKPKPPKSTTGGASASGPGISQLTPAECPTCQTCRDTAATVARDCTELDEQMTACQNNIAAQQIISSGRKNASQTEVIVRNLNVVEQCRREFQSRIKMCEGAVSACSNACQAAAANVNALMATPIAGVRAATEQTTLLPNQQTCQQGETTVGALKAADTKLAGNQSQLLEALLLLGPLALQLGMELMGNKGAGDLCTKLAAEYGKDHVTYQGACGDRYQPDDPDKPDPKDIALDPLPGPKAPGTETANGPNPGNQEFTGTDRQRRGGSAAREQSVEAGGAGGPMMGMDGSSAGTTRYDGDENSKSKGYNTSILNDPDGGGAGGGYRGAGAGQRTPSQWLEGQGSSARAQAEAHRRMAEAEAQRRRELRGPHGQGLFESVSEAYKRYRHEMMQ